MNVIETPKDRDQRCLEVFDFIASRFSLSSELSQRIPAPLDFSGCGVYYLAHFLFGNHWSLSASGMNYTVSYVSEITPIHNFHSDGM